ncbi:putative ribonuclease H-like domain-containing protein [Tanacetum coccineum]|uniref:Ribonuclease H-like domain-containing protein n=1 Tax=Tanacetum coccineum TaxID=301880 RepID=A0ABQ4ZDT2_9ASTR
MSSRNNVLQSPLKRFDYIDAQDYKEIDGGFVAFGGNSKGGKITGKGSRPNWLCDIDALTKSMNYKLVVVGNQSNSNAGTKAYNDAGKARMKTVPGKDYILLPMWPADLLFSQDSKSSPNARFKPSGEEEKTDAKDTNTINTVSPTVNAAGIEVNVVDPKSSIELLYDPNMPELEDNCIFHKKDERCSRRMKEPDDVKSAFLCGKIEKKVYVCQPPGFEDPDFPDRIGNIDKTLFIRRVKSDILLVQVYVDDIIFGLQVKQKEDEIFISQDKYVTEILKKFGFINVKTASTPMKTHKPLLKDAWAIHYEEIDGGFVAFGGRKPALSFMRPFGCPVTILNTIDHLGKFDGKADEGFFIGYFTNSKAFKVFNSRTRIVEENLHVQFSENTPNIVGSRPNWIFDIDALTKSINYKPVVAGNQSNSNAGTKACNDAGKARMKTVPGKYHILLPMWPADLLFSQDSKRSPNARFKPLGEGEKKDAEDPRNEDSEVPSTEEPRVTQKKDENVSITSNVNTARVSSTNTINTVSPTVNAAGIEVNVVDPKSSIELPYDPKMPKLEDIIYSDDDEDVDNGFQRGNIDKTLFIRRVKSDILLVQVYVDDIIFGSTKKSLCIEFKKMMHKKFQMNSMGELIFFLGLQVKQKEDGIFISQDKYVIEILKKFGFTDVKTASIPMETHKPLLKDAYGEDVDEHLYRSMIGSLMYLTSLRPDIMFVILKGQPKVGLWYPKDYPCDLVAYTDSDYAAASLDRKSTTGGCQFLGCRLILWQCKKQTVTKIHIDNKSTICIVKNLVFHLKTKHIEIRHHFNKDSNEKKLIQMIKIYTDQNVADLLIKAFDFWDTIKTKTVNGEVQLQALVDKKKVIITESTIRRDLQLEDANGVDCLPNAVPQPSSSTDNVPNENVPTTSNDPLLSGEDRLKLTELMDLCTNLQKKVLDLEKAKTAQDIEIASLKKKVKKLERRNKSRTSRLKRLRKVVTARRVESFDEANVTLIDETQGRNDDNLMFDTCVLDEQEVEVEKVVSTAEVTTKSDTTTTVDELTLAQTLIEIKAAKPKVALNLQAQLQAELEEEERLIRQKEEETNIALIESWDNTQAMMNADYQMAQQLQAEEQEQLSIEEKSKLFVQILEAIKKHFAKIRAKEKRNKPPTQAQQRKLYCNYQKNMEGYTLKQLKGFKFEVIKDMFDKAFKRVNIFVDYKTELVKGSKNRIEDSTKRAGKELEQEVAKKQKIYDAKVDNDQEEARMKELMNIVPDEEEVAIDAIPLAIKPPCIVDYKIIKEEKISQFQIIRADGSSKRYSAFIHMLKNFDREDLETLWKLMKAKHESTRPEEGYERVLCGDLMTMFKPDVESPVWRTLQNEKVYSLTPATITGMLNKKLQANHWNEICYQLLHHKTAQKSWKCLKASSYFIRLFGITVALIKVSVAQEERVTAAGTKLQLLTELQLLMDKD